LDGSQKFGRPLVSLDVDSALSPLLHDNTARVWDANSGQLITVLQGHEDSVENAAFSPDGQRVITASRDKTARLWDADSGKLLYVLKHNRSVSHAAFSPDGQRVVTVVHFEGAFLWDSINVKFLYRLGHKSLRHAVFSPVGTKVVTTGDYFNRIVSLWEAENGQLIKVLKGHEATIYHAAFSPDGQRLVTASEDKTARLWNINSGELLFILQGHDSSVHHAVFSPDGQRVVTASEDKTARLWEAHSGELLKVMRGHKGEINNAAFSPDGQRVVTASDDGTARLWDAKSGKPVAVMEGHKGEINSVAFSPEGSKVVTVSDDNMALLWRVFSTQELIDYANKIVPRCFTPEQREQFLLPKSKSQRLIDNGEALAQDGQVEAAIVDFQKALKLEACLKFNPEDKARLVAQTAVQRLVKKGLLLAGGDEIKEAIATYDKAQQIDVSLITADDWYKLCRFGSLNGYTAEVMDACTKAVELAPEREWYRKSRGVTRAVTGNLQGAIADFQFFVERVDDSDDYSKERKQQVQGWLEVLRRGENPFTPEEIERFRFSGWW